MVAEEEVLEAVVEAATEVVAVEGRAYRTVEAAEAVVADAAWAAVAKVARRWALAARWADPSIADPDLAFVDRLREISIVGR